jgi:hypothetical protein
MSRSWTDEALRFLARKKHTNSDVKLAAMNYANCTFVGGNYSDGGYVRAQEEELCRQFPALFASLQTCPEAGATISDAGMAKYKSHVFGARFGEGYAVARNVLFTDEVECMRGGQRLGYTLYQDGRNRVKAGFVSAAAPLFDRGHDHDFQDWFEKPDLWYEKVFLNVFLAPKLVDPAYDAIVVGPWGCGAFANNPETVVNSFRNVIKKHNILRLYKEVHFCLGRCAGEDNTVGGNSNANVSAFEKALETPEFKSIVKNYTEELHADCEAWIQDEADLARRPTTGVADQPPPETESAQ